MRNKTNCLFAAFLTLSIIFLVPVVPLAAQGEKQDDETLTEQELKLVEAVEAARIKVVNKVIGSVVAIYGDDKQGGGSGVIIDPSGIALTNHHVIMGAGVEGWGGIADGKLYRWKLIGTDPGGDVSLIQLTGKDKFPHSELGDSDKVRVGDWAFAMGNPFVLTEDQVPTVTLGIVSGIKRFQGGTGRTGNQLVYGNCIQIDSSINPGNSGGPLFNMNGEVIGINGRGSFRDRGRVNVGLGYAISSNQIKNFIPDLLATKLTEHGTLDAHFSDRDGKVVCSTLDLDSPVAKLGLELEDELLKFEGIEIETANQFKNLICTLPEEWPADLTIRKKDGTEKRIVVRLYGLPYAKPRPRGGPPKKGKDGKEPTPEQKRAAQKRAEMMKLLSAKPGTIRDKKMNAKYAKHIIAKWKQQLGKSVDHAKRSDQIVLTETISDTKQQIGTQKIWLTADGRFRVEQKIGDETKTYFFDGKKYWRLADGKPKQVTKTQAKMNPAIAQATVLLASNQTNPFQQLGKLSLDGSGKAMGAGAYRFKVVDENNDWYYFWLTMYDNNGQQSIQLVKGCCEKDADDNSGAWTLQRWSNEKHWQIPKQRELVDKLHENTRLIVKTVSAASGDKADDSLYTATSTNEEKK